MHKVVENKKDTAKDLKDKLFIHNVVIGCLPGMGLNTLVKQTITRLSDCYVINLYPHESYSSDYSSLEKLLFEKIRLETNIDSRNVYSLSSSLNYIKEKARTLVIVVNTLDAFMHQSLHASYLNSLCRFAPCRVTVLVSCTYAHFIKIQNKTLSLSLQPYLHRGYISDFDELFERMVCQYEIGTSVFDCKKEIFDYTLGHVGLLKSTLLSFKDLGKLPSTRELLSIPEVLRRISEVFACLNDVAIPLNLLVSNSQDERLEEIGLAHNGQVAKLFLDYYLTLEVENSALFEELTNTESAVFRILRDSGKEYVSLDRLAYLLGGQNYEAVSDWMLYKHLNNLSKKLVKYNVVLENRRGHGYRFRN